MGATCIVVVVDMGFGLLDSTIVGGVSPGLIAGAISTVICTFLASKSSKGPESEQHPPFTRPTQQHHSVAAIDYC